MARRSPPRKVTYFGTSPRSAFDWKAAMLEMAGASTIG
jgi:hypothetical protein